ncbi:MAG: hypothetical protein ALECFALPRED_000758 [Alectoria fallacina]|uniref:Uncharacterized protein n=1 Tax=Alectoria fallacina TaxID=1903189 RepID=A0A8H3JAV8_9LECA|nr:MAG: hypothetical protein ALECFALPRED_000758 [Alectoria fallacina]
MLFGDPTAEPLLPDETDDKGHQWAACEKQSFKDPVLYRGLRYWAIAIAFHGSIFLVMLLTAILISPLRIFHPQEIPWQKTIPIAQDVQYKSESLPFGAWASAMYMGEPNLDVDNAWESLIYRQFLSKSKSQHPRGFQLHRDEAAGLNFTESLLVQPDGEKFGAILGVIHNLHCLWKKRRVRQSYYQDVYYPNATAEILANNRNHDLHCFEALRSSLVCYPDLNPHPYYWSGREWHDVTVSSKVTRQCVDWEALQESLVPRDFRGTELIRETSAAV